MWAMIQMTNEYLMASPSDFLNVPADKIDECLADFKSWILFDKKVREMVGIIPKDAGLTVDAQQEFHWIDDGIRDGMIEALFKLPSDARVMIRDERDNLVPAELPTELEEWDSHEKDCVVMR